MCPNQECTQPLLSICLVMACFECCCCYWYVLAMPAGGGATVPCLWHHGVLLYHLDKHYHLISSKYNHYNLVILCLFILSSCCISFCIAKHGLIARSFSQHDNKVCHCGIDPAGKAASRSLTGCTYVHLWVENLEHRNVSPGAFRDCPPDLFQFLSPGPSGCEECLYQSLRC